MRPTDTRKLVTVWKLPNKIPASPGLSEEESSNALKAASCDGLGLLWRSTATPLSPEEAESDLLGHTPTSRQRERLLGTVFLLEPSLKTSYSLPDASRGVNVRNK